MNGKGKDVDDCPIHFPYCYHSCFFWDNGKCAYKSFETETDLQWLEGEVRRLKALAFAEAGYGTPEKKARYMTAVNAYDAVLRLIKKIKGLGQCKRCGGQLIRNHEDIFCLQCSAPHDDNGELISTIDGKDVKPKRTEATKETSNE